MFVFPFLFAILFAFFKKIIRSSKMRLLLVLSLACWAAADIAPLYTHEVDGIKGQYIVSLKVRVVWSAWERSEGTDMRIFDHQLNTYYCPLFAKKMSIALVGNQILRPGRPRLKPAASIFKNFTTLSHFSHLRYLNIQKYLSLYSNGVEGGGGQCQRTY